MTDRTTGAGLDRPGATGAAASSAARSDTSNAIPATAPALFVLDPSGRIRDVNHRACALLRMPADGLRGLPLLTFVDTRHRAQLTALDEALRSGRSDQYRTVVGFGPGAAAHPAGSATARTSVVRATRLHDGTVVTVESVPAAPGDGGGATTLTPVEAALLELTAEGLTTAQIAKRLHYSDGNVNYHLALLGSRFGTKNRTALVSRAYVLGVLHHDAWPPKATRVTRSVPPASG